MKSLPRLRFAHLPTPVESLPRLAAELGVAQLYCKRDDQTGLAFGRKQDPQAGILAGGSAGQRSPHPDHCRRGAIQPLPPDGCRCRPLRFGMHPGAECAGRGTARKRPGFSQRQPAPGPPVRRADRLDDAPERDQTLKQTFNSAWDGGQASLPDPLWRLQPCRAQPAYAFALQELLKQDVNPDWIVFASSSGGTQAGLALGKRLFGYAGKILGISVDELEETSDQAGCLSGK